MFDREVESVATAAVADLDEQSVDSRGECELGLLLSGLHASGDVVIEHQRAVEPDLDAVVAAEGELHLLRVLCAPVVDSCQ